MLFERAGPVINYQLVLKVKIKNQRLSQVAFDFETTLSREKIVNSCLKRYWADFSAKHIRYLLAMYLLFTTVSLSTTHRDTRMTCQKTRQLEK